MNDQNIEVTRYNMIEQQIRPWDVLNLDVLEVLASTSREDFVPAQHRALAFTDMEIPLDHGEIMMAPKVEGRLLQALDITATDHILEIGTGSGYLTACLAKLGKQVDSVDLYADFTEAAKQKLAAHGIDNVTLDNADGIDSWRQDERFDVIAITGSLPEYKHCFERSLAIGGRLFVIVGEPPVMEAMCIRRVSENEFSRRFLFETSLPPLVGATKTSAFAL